MSIDPGQGPPGVSTGDVRVGRFVLTVGAPAGTTVRVVRDAAAAPPPELAAAAAAVERLPPGAAALEGAVETAEEVTSRVERALELFTLVATGRLDAEAIKEELEALLGLLARLDRSDRFEDVLRLAHALQGLLALCLRWIALVEALGVALRAAQALGAAANDVRGWVLHELGTLALSGEDAQAAERLLQEARSVRAQAGDVAGVQATDANLAALRALTGGSGGSGPSGHTLVLVAIGAVLALLLVAVFAVGDIIDGDTETSTTAGSTTTRTTPVTPPPPPPQGDNDAPAPTLTVEPLNDGYTNEPTVQISGTAGTAAGDRPNVEIRIYAGETASGEPTQRLDAQRQAGDGAYSTSSQPLVPGTYTALTVQRDAAGNEGTSDAVSFTVDDEAPEVRITAPTQTVRVNAMVSGTAGTEPGDDEEVVVRIYRGQASTGTPDADPVTAAVDPDDGSWTVLVPLPIEPGEKDTFTVTASQSDAAGNDSLPASRTFAGVGPPAPPPPPPDTVTIPAPG